MLAPKLLAPRRDALSAGALAATGMTVLFIAHVPSFGPLFANFVSSRYKAFAMPSSFTALALSSGDFAWGKMRAASRGLCPLPRIGLIGGAWLGAIVAAFAVCMRYAPGTQEHPVAVIATLIVLVPVLGIMGAPLALQLNRCR